jgi:hypothetical protein
VAAPSNDADSLIVSLDDVRRIADLKDLTSYPYGDRHQPANQDADSPAPCRSAYDQQVTFGTDWNQFRTVTYNALVGTSPGGPKKMYVVTQAVGIYPDTGAAQDAFDRLVPNLEACSALHVKYYDFTVSRPNPSTVTLDYAKQQPKIIYRVKSSTLIDIVVQGFPQSEQIADSVLQTIADRIV